MTATAGIMPGDTGANIVTSAVKIRLAALGLAIAILGGLIAFVTIN